MGNILSVIQDDINEYEYLCRKYKEEVQTKFDAYGNRTPDCYGDHALALNKRFREETTDTTAMTATPITEEQLQTFTVKMNQEGADKLKSIFPNMASYTFLEVALTVLNWIHEEEAKGRVILSSTPEGTDVTRLVPLIVLAKQE
jgi:hypothetical protein